MGYPSTKRTSLFFVLFTAILLCFSASSFGAGVPMDGVSQSSDLQLVEGKIKRYNPEEQSLVLQMKNGEKLTILIDWNTSLVGYDSPQEIEKKQQVKIWYSGDSQQPTAVKIEKKLMVGC